MPDRLLSSAAQADAAQTRGSFIRRFARRQPPIPWRQNSRLWTAGQPYARHEAMFGQAPKIPMKAVDMPRGLVTNTVYARPALG